MSARATHLKAEMGKFLMTTNERKQMSTKTIFKRIALVAVATLGLGMLSVAPSQAAVIDETLTLSASSASVTVGETASVTITNVFTIAIAGETSSIVVVGAGAAANTSATSAPLGAALFGLKTDSINATFSSSDSAVITSRLGITVGASDTISVSAAVVGTYVQAKFRLDFRAVTNAGTYTYTIYSKGVANTINKQVAFTLTVVAKDTTAVVAKTRIWINQALFAGVNTGIGIAADSALVVSAGVLVSGTSTPVAVGYVHAIFNNAADTNTVTGSAVTASLIVAISGPGWVSSVGATTKAKSVTIVATTDTITVWSDGTAGTGTITGYIGTTALAQAAKTVVFNGKATTFTPTANAITAGGNNLLGGASDSVTAGTAIVTFVAKDAAANVVATAALNTNSAFYVISSDSTVVRAVNSATLAHQACTLATASTGTWTCTMDVVSAGTATLTIADSLTVASSAFTSAAITIVAAGAGFTNTIAFDKATYAPGEKAIITTTSKDSAGRNVGQSSTAGTASTTGFSTIVQNKTFSGTLADYTLSGSTFNNGVETVVVYMPTTAGDVTITALTSVTAGVGTSVTATAKVVDPIAAAIAAAKDAADAAKDAADAATDAATEATDAANEATAAALLAAEAADAATVAAEEARDAADAATAAIADLATQVATFMTALKAQITTLANTIAKIAKKIKA